MRAESVGLETLLDLDGYVLDQGDGHWVKIQAFRVNVTIDMPHGIRYALTLHDRYGKRLLGYDNAHAVKSTKGRGFAGRRLSFDHKHRHASDPGVPYEFESAYQLLQDFFRDVDRFLDEV